MFLAFNPADIITVPFGYLLSVLYEFTNNYGLAMILFAVLVKLIMLPITAKSKKSTMKMSRLSPRVQAIQKKYEGDTVKQNEAIQALYKEEGASMGGGCLWSFVPILILFPLFSVIRYPLEYMLHESDAVIEGIKTFLVGQELIKDNDYYWQILAASMIPEHVEALKAAVPAIAERTLEGIDFSFLGINLGIKPAVPFFSESWKWDWAHIGAVLIPVLSAGSQILSMQVSQRMNNSVITDEKGVQDKETAAKSQAAQTGKMMMWIMPVMSLWIGFQYPSGLSLYWFVQGIVSILIDVYLTQRYRKIYDAEDAERLKKAMEEEAIEAEKERIRAERRAANPEGITSNTSKKKLQQKQRSEAEAAKAEAAREYAAKKGIVTEEAVQEKLPLSGDAQRPYSRGRAYDPHRYDSTEE